MLQKQKDAIYTFIFLSPFCLLLTALLLGSANCHESYFCIGYPAFLQHSAFFDFFLLRADFTNAVQVSHWSSELLIAIFPFIVFVYTKNSEFAFSATMFYAIQHEILWMLTLLNHQDYSNGGIKIDFWLAGYIAISLYFLWQYRKTFFTKEYFMCIVIYYIYLALQWAYWHYQPNDASNFAFDETGTVSWLVWTIMILILLYFKRKVEIKK